VATAQVAQQYEDDTDTDDENNSSVINDKNGSGAAGGNSQTLKKEVKNYKKCRKLYFFLNAIVSHLIFIKPYVGPHVSNLKAEGDFQ